MLLGLAGFSPRMMVLETPSNPGLALIDLEKAAEILGVSPDELVEMRERNEIHGYRDELGIRVFTDAALNRKKTATAMMGARKVK